MPTGEVPSLGRRARVSRPILHSKVCGCLGLGLWLICWWPLAAATTGKLIGSVVDEEGTPMPGVAVSASAATQIGGVRLTETDLGGRFQYPNLAPGSFTVRLSLTGFVTQELTEVQVRVDRTTELWVTLAAASFGDALEVFESTPVVDPMQISTGQTFSDRYITETAGMFGTWQALISQAAGTGPDDRIMGSTPEDNTYLLDNMDATNKWRRGSNFAASLLPVDSLQEVAFHSAGFEAEYGQATGGVINVVTKSGGNQFAGTLDVRYSDSNLEEQGDHYDPEEQVSESSSASVTLGGPILRDRLWFFGALRSDRDLWTPTGAPTTAEINTKILFGKLTWQASRSWSAMGKLSVNPSTGDQTNSSQFVAPEATDRWEGDMALGSAELTGVLSDRVLWSLRLGRQENPFRRASAVGDLVTIGHRNLVNGESYGNFSSHGVWEDIDNEIATEVNWFLEDLAGSHDLRAGARLGAASYMDDVCFNGPEPCRPGIEGYVYYDGILDSAPIPLAMLAKRADGEREFGADYQAVYMQDAWRVRSDLTLKLGMRWDRATYDNNRGQIANLTKLQPRLGVAWDVTRNGRNLVRGSWGRFMSPSTMFLSYFNRGTEAPNEFWISCSNLGVPDPSACAQTATAWNLGYRTDPEGWDPAGWLLFPENVEGFLPGQVADNLDPMYVDQWMIGFERELFRRTALEVSYVSKTGADLIEDTCNGNYPLPSEGAVCDYFITANLPGMRSDYEAWFLRFESRALDRLHLLGSWVMSDSKGSLDSGTTGQQDFDIYPYTWENRYGYRSDQSRHRVKLSGYALLPYDFTLAVNGWWSSEYRWTPFGSPPPGSGVNPAYRVFLEPRGSGEGGSRGSLDLQVGKGFRIGMTRLRLLGSVFNLFDSENPIAVCERATGCGDSEMGDPIEWQQPRSYQLALRLEF